MEKMMWKRFIAGFMAFALLFLSVDHGCITAVAADLQDKSIDIQYNTGRLDVHMVPITVEESKEISFHHYVKYDGANYGSAYYKNEWEKYSSYYYYNQLSVDYKEAWDALNDLCLSYLTSNVDAEFIEFSDGTSGYYTAQVAMPEGSTEEDLKLFYDLFVMSNPQYYFVANGMIYAEDFSSLGVQIYDSWEKGTERAKATELFKSKLDLATEYVNQGVSSEEKLLLAHDYIVENVEYNDAILEDGDIDYDEEHASYSQSAYSALCIGLTVCAGYSEAMQLLCNGVGIDTLCVTSNNHQWNKVRINDSWYNVDPTWADQEYTDGTKCIWYEHYARNDETYVQDSSHVMKQQWSEFVPESTIDVEPSNEGKMPGAFPVVDKIVAAPVISIEKDGLEYVVTIITETENTTIYYTLNGTEPSSASSKSYEYDGTFRVPADAVIKAIAVRNTYLDSEIVTKNIANLQEVIIVDKGEYIYTGSPIEPKFEIYNSGDELLVEGRDYTISCTNNQAVGTATAEITFIGDYADLGVETRTFEIKPIPFGELQFVVESQTYTGQALVPNVIVKYGDLVLEIDKDYKLEFEDLPEEIVDAGSYSVKVVLQGNYSGTKDLQFEILPIEIATEDLTLDEVADIIFTGDIVYPEVIVRCERLGLTSEDGSLWVEVDYAEGVDYINAGTVEFTAYLVGNYSGSITGSFKIVPITIDENQEELIIANIAKQEYTGKPILPSVQIMYDGVLLEEGVDYELSVEEGGNIEIGSVELVINFIGNYTGNATKTFEIVPPKSQSITSDKVDVNDETGYISKISADTTVADFIATLGDDVTVKILKGETTVEGSALLGTGMKVCVMNAGQVVNEYTVIVTGDTNGDGKISITDMIAAKAHLLNKELLTGASAKAADVAGATDGGDGKISITDFIKVKAHLLKKDAIEGVVVK